MTAARRAPANAHRKAIYAKIAIARKQLAMDDDTYRDMLDDRFGVRSSTRLTFPQLEELLAHFKHLGFRPTSRKGRPAGGPNAAEIRKARALWIALYNLGLVKDASERALNAFGERQTGKAALQWIRGDWFRVIEALKAWAARPIYGGGAGVDWRQVQVYDPATRILSDQDRPRVRVIEAQWKVLIALGVFDTGAFARLDTWLRTNFGVASPIYLNDGQADDCQRRLGEWIRRVKAKGGDDDARG